MNSFSFSGVVGNHDLKLALTLAAIDPRIGGVLARGEKGTGKTTLARAFAGLLAEGAPFVELPLGATEDRVLGSIDVAATLATGSEVARAGLLAGADGGVVYVDEVNLLADHLVDSLLDAAASGVVRIERDGISLVRPARFVLIGTMNPEEGELRPQLLDRFGLCVDIAAPATLDDRVAVVAGRLRLDTEPADPVADRELATRLAATLPAALDEGVIRFAAALAVAAGAEGLRADIVLCRAAAALAGWEGRDVAEEADVERVAPLVLAHRRRRGPFDPPSMGDDELEQAIQDAREQAGSETEEQSEQPSPPSQERAVRLGGSRVEASSASGRRDVTAGARGRLVRDVPYGDPASGGVAVAATVRNVSARGGETIVLDDVRGAVHEERAGALVVIAVDTSGSMGADQRVEAALGVATGLLTDAYQRRDRVAVVAFGGDGARVVLAPTGSVEVARARLADLATGGRTPLADGLRSALDVVRRAGPGRRAVLVVITDGRATAAPGDDDPWTAALAAAADVAAAPGVTGLVVDAETGTPRLGLAAELAQAMGAPCQPIDSFDVAALRR